MFWKKRRRSNEWTSAGLDEILGQLDTGDLVLFSGKTVVSRGIKWFTFSKWSHVGVVLNLPDWKRLLLWESLTEGYLPDVEHGEIRQGIQLVDLAERISQYGDGVAVRRLALERSDQMRLAVAQLLQELRGRPYEKSNMELIRAAVDVRGIKMTQNAEDLSNIFCSELVAEVYQRMGLLPENPPSNEYTPHDFSADRNLHLLKGALGPEILVK